MNALLDEAIQRVNQRLRCRAGSARMRRVLVRTFHRLVAADVRVPDRKLMQGLGYGAYAAWLESEPGIDRHAYGDRGDIFTGIPFGTAPVLSVAGVCSTVRLGDVRTGVDKVDHFLEDGWRYLRRSRWGVNPVKAVRWGTWTENTFLGWLTSSAFSRADLYANWQGLQFYLLLWDAEGGLVRDGEDGCLERTGTFSWGDWLDPYWDELRYPTTFRPRVQRWLDTRLDEGGEAWCEGWATWGAEVLRAETPDDGAPWIGAKAKPRTDPWRLVERCGLPPTDAQEPPAP